MKCSALTIIFSGLLLNLSGGDLSKNIIFRLDFEKGLKPDVAKGNATPNFLGNKEMLKFSRGIRGKGLVTGIAKQAVRFKAPGNINPQKGTVSFWVKGFPGVRWNLRDRKFYHFFQWINKDNIRIYKYSINSFTRFYERKKIHFYPPYKEDEWNFFAFTWNGPDLKWYLNGELVNNVIREKPFPPVSKHSFFEIGQFQGKGGTENRVTDELIIYNRPLTRTEIFSLYAAGTGLPTKQIVRLSKTAGKIKIDGIMSPGEWRDAATVLIGLDTKTKSVAETISKLYLAYDDKYLYFYLKSPIPKRLFDDAQNTLLHGFYTRNTRKHDAVMNDDALEFRLKPSKQAEWYRLMVNTLDVKYDSKVNSSHRQVAWNPGWITKTGISDDGWDLEGKIPFSSFSGTHAPGTIWQMNVYRIWKKLKKQIDAWSNDNYDENIWKNNTGKLVFGGQNNVSVAIDKLTGLSSNTVDLELRLRGEIPKPEKVSVELLSGDQKVLFKKEMMIAPNKNVPVKLNCSLNEQRPDRVILRVMNINRKITYWQADIPVFKVEDMVLAIAYLPLKKCLSVSGEFPQLELNTARTIAVVSIKQNNKVLVRKKVKPANAKFTTILDTAKLPTGQYSAEVKLYENNQVVATESSEFKIAPPPAWLGNKLGITKEVPPSWTPVKYQPDKISVWGREYIYRDGLFPAQIDAGGDALLAAPVKLDFGRNIFAGARAKVEKISADDTQATFLRTITLPQLTVKVKTRIEFDGMMWNTLELIPRNKDYEVKKLSLDIPMAARNATLMMPHDYSLKNTGHIRKWHGSIRPLWVGNEERGLCFFTEHSYNWIVNDRQKELEIIPGSKEVLLKVNLIDHPAAISKPLKLEFGLMATPVKEMRKDQRSWRINHFTKQMTPERNARYIQMPFRKWAKNPYYETCYPVADPKMRPVRGVSNRCKWEGLLYHQLKRTWAESPEAKMFAYEWTSEQRVVPTVDANPDNRQIEVCQGSKSFQDFLVNGLAKVQKEVNPGGFYFDVANPKKCSNLNHGCGYVVNGEVRPTFNILGAREMIKRIYIATKKIRPDSIIAYHVSGQVCLPVHSFADLLFEGENFCSILHDNRGYEETLTLDTYRAEHMGHNFGPAVTMLPEFNITSKWLQNTPYAKAKRVRKDKAAAAWLKRRKAGKETKAEAEYWRELTSHINYLLGLSLLHDNPFWVAAMYNMQPVRKHYHILDKFNYAGGDNKFIPYWKQQAAKVVSPGKAVVSFYTSKERAVAVIMNMSPKEADVKLRLDFARLGLDGTITASGLEYKNPVSLKGDLLTVKKIPSHQYRVVMLKN